MKTYDEARTGASHRARQLRRDSTDAERKMWRALRSSLPEFRWRRQMPVGPYFVDFACFAKRLVVEIDGGQHAKAAEYDAARTRYLENQDYRVMRFWNNDVLGNIDGVIEAVAESLSLGRGKEQRKLRKGEVVSPLARSTSSPSHSASPSGALPLPRERAI